MEINKHEDYVVVLGSGESINHLTELQRKFIDACSVKIGINKYAAFYEQARILPTHIYIKDDFSLSSRLMLSHIVSHLRKKQVKNLTFIVSLNYRGFLCMQTWRYVLKKGFKDVAVWLAKAAYKLNELTVKQISYGIYHKLKSFWVKVAEGSERYNLMPQGSTIHYITTQDWNSRGNVWAKSINEPLYHFRGSFSTVLNYISILFPQRNILLVGVDFNSPGYFFQRELEALNFNTKDWTHEVTSENRIHFSIVEYEGTRIDDEIPFMIEELKKTGNKIFCINKNSYLVEKGFIPYLD